MDPIRDKGAREALFKGQAHLYKLMLNHLTSMSLKCALELGVADVIRSHGGPITLSELATALGIQPTKTDSLFRVMRLLVHSGVFSRTKGEAYGLTPTSTLLLKDESICLSPNVSVFVDPFFTAPFSSLSSWFIGAEPTLWETVHGSGITFWEFFNRNPELSQRFNQAMASDSELSHCVVRDSCKGVFEGVESLVDVGGGNGSFARIIAESFPRIKCTVLDLPHAVAGLHASETDNLKFMAGDLFHYIPPADAFLFKVVFHGLGDEDALKVLKKLREGIASNGERGKVIIIDIVIKEEEDEHELTEAKLLFDAMMSVNAAGKERTEREWEKLFSDAGFLHYKVTPMFGIKSLIEVFPLTKI